MSRGLIRLRGLSLVITKRCIRVTSVLQSPVIGWAVTEKAQQVAQIEKLLASQTLHGSESLCKLLRYLAHQAWEHAGSSPKEYQIATEVFGRQQDFDPHVDSMVRVQAGRLRAKLAEYYAGEGAEDTLLVEMPKGNYALTYHQRPGNAMRSNGEWRSDSSTAALPERLSRRPWFTPFLIAALVLTAVLAIAADRFLIGHAADAHSAI